MKRTFKRSELEGVTGWRSKYKLTPIWLPSFAICMNEFECWDSGTDETACKESGDTPLQGQPLIDAIRNLGYEVVDDVAEHSQVSALMEQVKDQADALRTQQSRITDLETQIAEARPMIQNIRDMCIDVERGNWPASAAVVAIKKVAIDLMVKAIEAGDHSGGVTEMIPPFEGPVVGFNAQPDPYAHLPHGGWWVAVNDRLFWWSGDNTERGRRFTLEGQPHDPDGDGNWCVSWRRSFAIDTRKKLTRAQAIAIIERHKAEQAQPAPAFKVGDRVEVVAMEGNPVGTITTDTPHMNGCYVSIDGAESGWVGYSCLRPAPAEQKEAAKLSGYHDVDEFYREEPAKVDTLAALANAIGIELCVVEDVAESIANAIDAHIRAVALSLYTKGQADAKR